MHSMHVLCCSSFIYHFKIHEIPHSDLGFIIYNVIVELQIGWVRPRCQAVQVGVVLDLPCVQEESVWLVVCQLAWVELRSGLA